MRKLAIFMLLSMLLLTGLSFGQTTGRLLPLLSATTGKTSDTLANATTKNQTVKAEGSYGVVSVITNLAKISGTAAGKVYFLVSHDGTNFARAGGADSLVVLNVTSQSKEFKLIPSSALYYRIQFVGSVGSTQSVRFNSTAILRK